MFEFSRALNRDRPIHLYYLLGSETKERTMSYLGMLYEQFKRYGIAENRDLDYVLMQRGEYGRQLEPEEAWRLMKGAAASAGVDRVFPVHVLRGPDVDLNIASTFYREGGDESTIPRKAHEFGVRHQRWGNVLGPDGTRRSRIEVFYEALGPIARDVKEVIVETMRAKPADDPLGVFAIDGPSGAGKTSFAERLEGVLVSVGLK
jgi:hypothetical protein